MSVLKHNADSKNNQSAMKIVYVNIVGINWLLLSCSKLQKVMDMIERLITPVGTSLFLFLIFILLRFFQKVWWSPISIQNKMRSQGIKGPPYKFLHGNTKGISRMRKDSMGRPMEGLLHNIFPRILPDLHSWSKKYGTNFLIWYGPQAELVVMEAELIKEILNNKNNAYTKIDLQGLAKKILGDGLSAAKGKKWAKLRKLANHAFHGESLKCMIPAMITSVEIMVERWKTFEGKEIEVFEEFRVLTSEVISKTAFGSSYMEGKKIFDMLMQLTLLFSRSAHKIRFPGISKFLNTGDDKESEKLEKGIQDCIIEIIKKREQLKDGELESSGSDFLGKLLEANQETDSDKWISVEEMVDECKTFYFAGHETTTSLLTWTVLLLAIHNDWQDKARKEVIEMFGQINPTSDAISRLKIMSMIIEESLRLYPPVPAIMRKVEKEVRLGNMILPPSMGLYIPPLALNHDPKIWGEDVHHFKPERFEGWVAKTNNNTAAAFFPFGFGPRTCVGLSFAMIETKIALSMILQRFTFTLSPVYIHSPIQLFMIRPQHGVQIILHVIKH